MKRRFLARTCGVFGLLVLASCFGESTGPGELRPGRFAIAPQFDLNALRLVPVDRVHIVLYHADNSVALDTTVVFPAGTDTLDLSFEVDIQGATEQLGLDVAMLDAGGTVVFQAPRTTVTATAGSTAPPAATPPMLYVGPGANAVGVRFLSVPSQVFFGDTVLFTAEAFDVNNVVVPAAPIDWSSSDTSRARVPDPALGRFVGNNTRGQAIAKAALLRTSATTPPAEVTSALLVQPTPNQIAVQSGNNQSGPIGSALTVPLTARVRAADNLGVSGVTVTFLVTSGGGSLSAPTAVTDANGDASVTWTLGPALGAQAVTATAAGVTGQTAAFNATGQTGIAAQLAFIVQPANSGANAPIAPAAQVEIRDAFGNRTNSTANVTLAIGANPGGSTLSGTTTVAAVAGVATFTDVRLNNAGTGYTLTASSGALTAATSTAFDISGGVPTQLAFVSQPTTTTAGAVIASFQVAIRDVNNNTVTGAASTVALTVTGNPAGVTLGGTVSAAAVNGVATFADLTIDRSGPGYTLTAASAGLTSATSAAFTIDAGAATQLVFTTQPPATVSQSAAFVVEVSAQDALGNIATAFTGDVTVAIGANPGGGTLSGTTTVAALSGTATFVDLAINASGSGYTLAASAPSLGGGTSNAFNVGLAAAINQWINTSGGNWSVAANWSKGTVPSATDTVAIVMPGTYSVQLDQNATVPMLLVGGASGTQTLTQSGFTLAVFEDFTIGQQGVHQLSSGGVLTGNGQGQFLIGGLLDLTGGTVSSAHLHVAAGGELYVTGSVSLTGDTVLVDGAFDVGGSTTLGLNSGTIVDIAGGGLLEFQSGGEVVQHQFGAAPLLTVQAGATVDVGATASFVNLSVPLVMDGSLSVPSGTLTLDNAVTVNGTVTLAAGTQLSSQGTVTFSGPSSLSGAGSLRVSGGTFTMNGTIGLAGDLLVLGGSIALNSPATFTTVQHQGGTLGGSGQLLVSTLLQWSDGVIGGGGGLVHLASGAIAQLQGTAAKSLQGNLDVEGTMVIDAGSAQTLGMNSGALLNVLSGGVLQLQGDHSIQHQFGGAPQLHVQPGGELRRSAGTGAATLNVPLLVDGALNGQTGQLDLMNAVTVNGTVTMAGGTLLRSLGTTSFGPGSNLTGPVQLHVPNGAFTMNGTYGLTGQLRVQGGTVELNTPVSLADVELSNGQLRNAPAAPLTVTFALNWSGGTLGGLNGPISIPAGATLSLSTATAKNIQSALVDVAGQLVVEAGPVQTVGLNSDTQLRILAGGVLELQGDHSLQHQFGGVPLLHVQAGATLTRSAGTGTVTFNVPMTVDGDVSVTAGSADFHNAVSVNGAVSLLSGALLRSNGTMTFAAGSALNGGASEVEVPGGTFTMAGNYALTGQLRVQGGTLVNNAASPLSLASVVLSNGTIGVNSGSQLNVSALTWSAGTIGGQGLVTVSGATLTTSASKSLQEATLQVTGSMVLAAGPAMILGINSGAQLQVLPGGSLDIQGDHSMHHQFGGAPLLHVQGGATMMRSNGAGVFTLNVPMIVDGAFDMATGNLDWTNTVTVNGTVTLPTGVVSQFSGTHTWAATAGVSGGGQLVIPTGSLTVEGNSFGITGGVSVQGGTLVVNSSTPRTLAVFSLAGGTLSGSGQLDVTSTMTWTAGTIGGGNGVLGIPGGATLTLSSAGSKNLQTHTLNVAGTMRVEAGPAQTLGLNSGAQLNVTSGGLLDVQGDHAIDHQFGGAGLLFIHPGGQLTRSAGGGTFRLNTPMQMQGNLSLATGTLDWMHSVTVGGSATLSAGTLTRLMGSNSWASTAVVSGGGELHVPSGIFSLVGTGAGYGVGGPLRVNGGIAEFNNSAPISLAVAELSGGTIRGSGELQISGSMLWNGGTIGGTGGVLTINAGSTLLLETTAAKSLETHTANVAGTMVLGTATFTLGLNSGAQLAVPGGGILDFTGDNTIQHQFGGVPTITLAQGSVLQRSAGSGVATIGNIPLGNVETNIVISAGTLSLNGGGLFNNTVSAAPGSFFRLGGGDWGMINNWTVNGDLIVENAAFEQFNSHTATINGTFLVQGATGRVDMTGVLDSLIVQGNATFGGGTAGTLNNGVLMVGGDFSQLGAGSQFRATAGHTTVLNGSGPQSISFQAPGQSRFAGLRITNTGSGVTLLSDVSVSGTLDLMDAHTPITGTARKLTLHNGTMLDTNAITPVFLVDELVIRGQPSSLPSLIVKDVTFDSALVAPPTFLTVGGNVTIKGLGATHAIVEASGPGGGLAAIGGNLLVTEDGVMNASYFSGVSVTGNATFASNLPNTGFTEGTLSIGGSFTQSGNPESFFASGNHQTMLTASGPSTISFANPGALSGSSHFANLTVSGGPYTIGSDVYTGNLTIIGSGGITGPHRLAKSGAHNFAVGPVLAVRSFHLGSPAGSDDGITYSVDTTILAGADFTMPSFNYNHLVIEGTDVFLGVPVSLPGDLTISGSFSLNANNMTVGGNFATVGQGVLRQQNFEILQVAGDVAFGGGSQAGLLQNGLLEVGQNFQQTAASSDSSFAADISHVVAFIGTGPQSIAMASPGPSRFGILRVSNTAAPVTALGNTVIGDELNLQSGATLTGAQARLHVTGAVVTDAGATLTPRWVGLEANIAATAGSNVQPDSLEWLGFGRLLATGPEINPANVIVNGTGNWTLTVPDTMTGDFSVRQGFVVFNGNAVRVGGSFSTVNAGFIQMTQPADSLLVTGNVTFAGGSTAGMLDAGLLRVGGNFVQDGTNDAESFHPNVTHTTEFNGTAAQTVTFSTPGLVPGTSHFGVLRLDNASAAGVSLLTAAHAHYLEDLRFGSTERLTGIGGTFQTQGLNVENTILDNVTLSVGDGQQILLFKDVTFTNMPSTATQLTVNRALGPSGLTFENLTFQTVPTGGGLYLAANGPFTLSMVNPNPATAPGLFSQSGGATVNWP